MVQHRLQPLLAPRSVAIVGAAPKQDSFGWSSYRALVDYGFDGTVHLVNPGYQEIDGRPCYPDLASIGPPVEHAMLNVANARLEGLLEATIAAGIPAATIFASGYLEGDPDLVTRLRARAAEAGLLICGGNGSGFYNHAEAVQISLGAGRGEPDIGGITLIAQSGSIYMGMVQTDGRPGFNLTVSAGQELAATTADYMDYALEPDSTRAIGLFLETVRDPQGFCAAAEKAQAHVMAPGGLVAITDSGGERDHLADLAYDAHVPFARISEGQPGGLPSGWNTAPGTAPSP